MNETARDYTVTQRSFENMDTRESENHVKLPEKSFQGQVGRLSCVVQEIRKEVSRNERF